MSYDNIVRTTLNPIYGDARFPVVFVTSKLDVAYANDCAKRLYPEICGNAGIRGIIGKTSSEKAMQSLENGEAVKVSSVGVRGIVSASFLPIGGILNEKCFIVHIEEQKELIASMYAETAEEYAEDITRAALRRPLAEMLSIIKLLNENENYMSDQKLKMYILSLYDGIQETMTSVRDLGYALNILGKRAGEHPQIFSMDAYLQSFCENYGCEYKNKAPIGLLSVSREKLDDALATILNCVRDKFKGAVTVTATLKKESLSITLRGKKYNFAEEGPDEFAYVDTAFSDMSEAAKKLGGKIIWKNKKTTLTAILEMTAALPEEPGSYLHGSDDPVYSENV